MKNKIFLFLSIALIIGGAIMGYFAKFDGATLISFAMEMFGAGLAVSQLWETKKPEAKKPLVILSMVFIGVGAFLAGFSRAISSEQVGQIISLIFSLILIVAGIVTSIVANTKAIEKKTE